MHKHRIEIFFGFIVAVLGSVLITQVSGLVNPSRSETLKQASLTNVKRKTNIPPSDSPNKEDSIADTMITIMPVVVDNPVDSTYWIQLGEYRNPDNVTPSYIIERGWDLVDRPKGNGITRKLAGSFETEDMAKEGLDYVTGNSDDFNDAYIVVEIDDSLVPLDSLRLPPGEF